MFVKILLAFTALGCAFLGLCWADDPVENGYIFTSPRYLKKGQNNQLQLIRFGCLEDTSLKVKLFYKKDYNSNETLAQQQVYHIPNGRKDALLKFFVKPFKDTGYIYSGRLQINGTMCGKKISGSDEVNFSDSNSDIYIIQTDKPLYKPGQTVKFRVLKVDKNLRPSDKENDVADVYVEDPRGTRLFQFKGVHLGKGITQNEFPLADEPVQGTWRITVNKDKDSQTTTFDVKEYKLPKFEVSIKFPPYVLENADSIPVSVCAQYTYGKPVQAHLNLNTSLEMYAYESSYYRTPILQNSLEIDGCYNYTINVTEIDPKRNNNYKRVQVSANVIEDETGVEVNKTEYLDRSYTPLNLDFNVDSNHGQYYKPGLPYNGKLKVTHPDNTPAPGQPIEICATVSRKRIIDTWLATKEVKYCKNYTSDANGYVKYALVPQNFDSTSINLFARSLKYTGENDISSPTAGAYLNPFYSPSGSFVQLETIDNPIPCGTKKNIRLLFTAEENTEFQLRYEILKQGTVVKSGSKQVTFNIQDDVSSKYENSDEIINGSETQISPSLPESSSSESSSEENCPSAKESHYTPPIGEVNIPIDVDASLSDSFTLLAFYVREDRETVADSQKIQVEKCFKNQVTFAFQSQEAQPGTDTAIQITSSPNSLCGVKVVDKSVSLLDSSDQLTKDKVFQFLSNLDPPTYYSSDFCYTDKTQPGLQSMDKDSKVNPKNSFYSSSYEDSYAAFQDAGFLVISNLILFSRPCSVGGGGGFGPMPIAGPDGGPIPFMAAGPGGLPQQPGAPGGPSFAFQKSAVAFGPAATQSAVEVRNYFPETWLFQLQMTGSDGVFQAIETLPHTITEWDGSAVCINSQDGLGLSDTASIKGFQAFFISYTLPISVIRGEEFIVVVSIYNYVDAALPVTVTLAQPQGFEVISDLSDNDICIQPDSSESMRIKLKGTKVGSINITVEAETASSSQVCGDSPVYDGVARDAITQSLEVEAEGFPNENVNSILFCPSDEETNEFSTSYNLNLPKDAVPGSSRAIVDVSGNVMGPAIQNLNNLVSLPTGCGEQNMVKFTPNYLVLDYLTDIGKLTDSIKSNAIQNLNTGYQRELTFRHYDGSFSAFGDSDREGSMFLTAFVLRSFYQAKRYIYIDDGVLQDAQQWIISKQQADGCFPNIGQIIDSGIQGGLDQDKKSGSITSHVLASLQISNYQNKTVIGNALECLSNNPPSTPYETFLYAYAEALAGQKSAAMSLINNIRPLAIKDGGLEYYRNPNGTKSLDVETAAYAVLANLQVGYSKSVVLPFVRYLSTNLNPSGGFYSTQDTCVGLDALSEFAKLVYADPLDISVSIKGGLNEQVQIDEDNKLLVQRNKVSQIPSQLNIEATGTGCGLLQISLRYNTRTPPEEKFFNLQVTGYCTSTDCKQRKISTAVRYTPQGQKSGMSVVQIKMISGTIAVKDSLNQLTSDPTNNILRADVENNQVNVYFTEISNNAQEFSFDVEEIVEVENPQPGIAKVFDYYAPEYSTSVSYTFGN
ncbi:alpha-2-macroglobulin-like [Argiope bruennichi]|uniref:alpha-2-macroglobulin-like n=1 Tax=Argiope bruennichi TaxID=94029 RepID=UPI002495627F|nr:alpha-2-macroglobulin-like [Argiope bruennichi]XP_055924187.1 alpha-2-macroglobulin-like [Argiope bruennichi]